MMATSYGRWGSMEFKDSIAEEAACYWLQTVLEDRAESAPPPAPVEPEAER
ncbi:hypothetical protein V1294_006052 [Bradyrhizobium sp. AZCC 1678]